MPDESSDYEPLTANNKVLRFYQILKDLYHVDEDGNPAVNLDAESEGLEDIIAECFTNPEDAVANICVLLALWGDSILQYCDATEIDMEELILTDSAHVLLL